MAWLCRAGHGTAMVPRAQLEWLTTVQNGSRLHIMESQSTSALQRLLDPQQVADMLRVKRKTVYEWVRARRIPEPMRIRGRLRWRESEIAKWVEAGCYEPGERAEDRCELDTDANGPAQ